MKSAQPVLAVHKKVHQDTLLLSYVPVDEHGQALEAANEQKITTAADHRSGAPITRLSSRQGSYGHTTGLLGRRHSSRFADQPDTDGATHAMQETLMEPERGLHHDLDRSMLPRLQEKLRRGGWHVLQLDGTRVVDEPSLLRGLRDIIDLIPDTQQEGAPIHWDALSDSLWESLFQLNSERVALLWLNSESLRMSNPRQYDTALMMLADLVESLGASEYTLERPTDLMVGLVKD